MPFKAIIFDCDGVIVDTETISNRILKNKLITYGLHLSDHEMHKYFSGFTADDTVRTAELLLGHSFPDTFKAELRAEFQEIIQEHLLPIQGIPELLQRVNVPIAMATNAQKKSMEFKLEKVGLINTFKHRFCLEDVSHAKPHPELYLMAAKSLAMNPKDCLVIEDSAAGIAAGIAAGMTVYGYSESTGEEAQSKAGAKMSFPTIEELTKKLEEIGLLM